MSKALVIAPLVLVCCFLASADAAEDVASDIVAMAGARTKIVWVHAASGDGNAPPGFHTRAADLRRARTTQGR